MAGYQQQPLRRTNDEPRAFSDHRLRERHSQQAIRQWREEAEAYHHRWLEVLNNPYGGQ